MLKYVEVLRWFIIFPLSTLSRSKLIEYYIQQEQDGESFYIGDLSQLEPLYNQWVDLLPRVEPFYAIKCNPNPQLVECLSKMPKMGFDCASSAELSLALNLDTPEDKIIYANPCKGLSHLKYAKEHGIRMMTFDNESELLKIKTHYPEAELVIRIMVEEFGSSCSFKEKFGASLKDAEKLLQVSKSLAMKVIGVSFHVGSGCKNPNAYYHAIKNCRQLFDFAKDELNYEFHFLDLGGGFSDLGNNSMFMKSASAIKEGLEEFFPEDYVSDGRLRIIAEPGRYFAQKIFTLVVSISSKKLLCNGSQVTSADDPNTQVDKVMYYVNEGLYSGFNCVIFDHAVPKAAAVYRKEALLVLDENIECVYNSVIWGPTCDGIDCISRELELPTLEVGDWIVFDNFGAYTMAASSSFNGFPPSKILWVDQ